MTRPAAAGGRSAGGARGRGHRARRAPPRRARPGTRRSFVPGGPRRPSAPPLPRSPGALSLRAAPRDSVPGPLFRRLRRSVGAAARPASRLHLLATVLPPVPLCCVPLLRSRVTCHSPGTRSLPFSFSHCLSPVYPSHLFLFGP